MAQEVAQIIFVRGSEVLLGFRQNTAVLDQLWGFPSGRIEPGESPEVGASRESLEEVGVEPIKLLFMTELPDPNNDRKHYIYVCDNWKGEIINAEPHLCREVSWFNIDNLPGNCTPLTYTAMKELDRFLRSNDDITQTSYTGAHTK